MKTEVSSRKTGWSRSVFCLILVLALVAGLFSLNGFAAGADPASYDVKVVSCSTHTAALSKGRLYVWGTNDYGQFPGSKLAFSQKPVLTLTGIADVSVSPNRTLVVDKTGKLISYGIEPATDTESSASGTVIATDAVQAAAGSDFAMYVTKSGALYSWGVNRAGQVGNGTTDTVKEPVCIIPSGVLAAEAGDFFSLALKEDGTLFGWGLNSSLQYGYQQDGLPVDSSSPVQVLDDVKQVSAGAMFTCAVKNDDTLWVCGNNDLYQTGTGSGESMVPFTQVLEQVSTVSSGNQHSLAVTKDGTVYGWGFGFFGQLGNGEQGFVPTPAAEALDFVQVFADGYSSFGVSPDGSISSFGSNTNYLLGKSNGFDSLTPDPILDGDMNWIYKEFEDSHDHGAPDNESSGSGENAGGENSAPDSTPEEEEPELVSLPFISGNGDGTFKPEKDITRAEFLKMVVVALCEFDSSADYGTSSFSDIPLNRWFENYVAYAELNKIVGGYDDGTFRPDAPITRAEATKMAALAMKLDIENAADAKFTDVSGWAAPYINAFALTGALQGDGDGTFKPERNITRAEAAKIVAAATGFQPEASEIDSLTAGVKNPFRDVSESQWYYVYLLRAAGLVK